MTSTRSHVALYDELGRMKDTVNQSCLEEFLRFATSQEECRMLWEETARENKRLKKSLDELNKENNTLDMKLNTARRLLDQEKNRKLRAEEERNKIERQLQMVRELLFADNRNHLHDETKEKLKFLNSTVNTRASNEYNDRLSAIHELDSTGSMLSDLSYSRSDDDLDIETFMRKKRTYKNVRPSLGFVEPYSAKRRRSSHVIELNGKESVVATTKVTMEHDGSISAQSQLETIPAGANPVPSAPERCGSMESVESGLSIENNTNYNQVTPGSVGVLPIGTNKIDLRNHSFVSKTVFRPEDCEVCEKRVKFASTVLRCQNCLGSCHPACKDGLPLPCIGQGNTPISNKNLGVLADYAPPTHPMIPALIVHCVNAIEVHGLSEQGIYRLTGSNKDIKALKYKFMKNRGVPPRLVDVDVHVLCGCLKDFLRNLKEPLVTHALWWQFVRAAETRDFDERNAKLFQAVSQLPRPNQDTLAFLILHLIRVAENKETNKMCIDNLALVLGPTIVGYSADFTEMEAYNQNTKAKLVLEQFLKLPADYWSRLLSSSSNNTYSTPLITDSVRSSRTPSTRKLRQLFDHTPAR